jgi:hypothetical protein
VRRVEPELWDKLPELEEHESQEQSPVYGNLADTMRASLNQIRSFDKDVEKLRKEGLSGALIRQLLAEGPTAGLPQAEAMRRGGPRW